LDGTYEAMLAPVTVRLTAGQAGDNPVLLPLLDDYAAVCTQHGGSGRDFRLLADKAHSHPSTRTELRSRRIKQASTGSSSGAASRRTARLLAGRTRTFACTRSLSKPDQATKIHPAMQVFIALVDVFELVLAGNQLIELESSGLIQLEHPENVCPGIRNLST
jgi:hypothetical protein